MVDITIGFGEVFVDIQKWYLSYEIQGCMSILYTCTGVLDLFNLGQTSQ